MVHDWIFFGRCRDNYGEFMLQTNHEFICRRGNESSFIVCFVLVTYYPQMPIGKVWIYRLQFVCVFVWLRISWSRIKLAASKFAR